MQRTLDDESEDILEDLKAIKRINKAVEKMKSVYNASPQLKTIIDDEYSRIYIGWDSEDAPENPETWRAILTYVDKLEDEHHHVVLELEEVIGLRNWLNKFILKVKDT